MDAANALQPITNHAVVRDRQAGQNRGSAEAFRRALQEQAGGSAGGSKDQPEVDGQPPVRGRLQPTPVARRQEQEARHIDVLA